MIDASLLNERRGLLQERLLGLEREDHLYASNLHGDSEPSITVSAIALQALTELREPVADLVYRAIVAARDDSDPASGGWPAQGGGPAHTISAAWAVFACSRFRLDAVHDMAPAVAWLLGLQSQELGGWPHAARREPRPFQTALVLNALLAYREQLSHESPTDGAVTEQIVIEAIDHGFGYLIQHALSSAHDKLWLWDQSPAGQRVCLATSSVCLHVALRASNLGQFTYLRAPALATLAALAKAFVPGALNQQRMEIEGVPGMIDVWPQIGENEPKYWYSYFTPLLGLTFADATRHESPSGDYIGAIEESVRWIVSDYDPDGSSTNAKGVWGIVNALLVLQRASAFVMPETRSDLQIIDELRRLGPELTPERFDFKGVCEQIDPSLISRITTPASPAVMWAELIDLIDGDVVKLLKAQAVIVEKYPNSDAARAIRDWVNRK